ncbi:hypothetical protein [Pseudonocardia sp. KRD291]|nr:hypothetical protein [Pseudonocardia sp. KRD291]MBW0103901.1 hypothetical protein [Pseudonocardia sp. KRD291]
MTAPSRTPDTTAISRTRPSNMAALALVILVCLSGLIPTAFVVLSF